MKNITFIFLLCSLSAFAQTTTKNFILSSDGVNYLEVTRITSEDGLSYTETANLVGPKSAITNDQADKILSKTASLAQSAYTVSYTKRVLSEVASSDSLITAVAGASAIKAIQDRYQAALLTPGWTIDQGAGLGFQPLVFTVNGAGTLKYSINGAATKNATIYGSIIRFASFPSAGNNTDFFIDESGKKYFSLPNRGVIIKLP